MITGRDARTRRLRAARQRLAHDDASPRGPGVGRRAICAAEIDLIDGARGALRAGTPRKPWICSVATRSTSPHGALAPEETALRSRL